MPNETLLLNQLPPLKHEQVIQLNYKVLGPPEGAPLIILHGLFGSLDNWQYLAKRWAEMGFQVFSIDQRNHGKSPHISNQPHDYPTLAHDLHDFMAHHELDSAIIIGHSMGGKVAMQFGHFYPNMVKQLIVVDMAPRVYKGGHEDVFEAIESLDLTQVNSRNQIHLHLASHQLEEGVIQFLLKNITRNTEGHFSWKMNFPTLKKDYQAILENIEEAPFVPEFPTLFVYGKASNYVNPKDVETYKTFFPNLKLEGIEGAGHWVHAENPEDFFEAVTEFITTNTTH